MQTLGQQTSGRRFDLAVVREILQLAGPLILSSTGLFLMHLVDGIFLSWHSAEAIAAVGPASFASLVVGSLWLGATGFTGTLVAQYYGAGRRERLGAVTWQGIHFALLSGLLTVLLAPLDRPLFARLGHPPVVYAYEVRYFEIMCWGMPVSLLANALSGFFSGRGDMRPLMVAQLTGLACNAGLAYVLTLGRFGFPALGVTGAALATVTSQGIIAALLFARFLRPEFRRECHTANSRGWDWRLMKTLMQFGLPNGFRFAVEVFGWTLFLFFIGRIGTVELAASTIAFRINGLAFFPLFGLAEAVRTLVGHAQGQLDHRRAARVTWHGLLVAEGWMLATAPLFLIFPHQCYALFRAEPGVVDTGVVLLRFVAAYCVLDAANVIIVGALQAAGDTRWTLRAVLVLYAGFFAGLAGADYWRLGLYVEWLVATVFVILLALVWLLRFHGGAWRHIRVIEPDPVLVAG